MVQKRDHTRSFRGWAPGDALSYNAGVAVKLGLAPSADCAHGAIVSVLFAEGDKLRHEDEADRVINRKMAVLQEALRQVDFSLSAERRIRNRLWQLRRRRGALRQARRLGIRGPGGIRCLPHELDGQSDISLWPHLWRARAFPYPHLTPPTHYSL